MSDIADSPTIAGGGYDDCFWLSTCPSVSDETRQCKSKGKRFRRSQRSVIFVSLDQCTMLIMITIDSSVKLYQASFTQ